jgi:hypothetical protein
MKYTQSVEIGKDVYEFGQLDVGQLYTFADIPKEYSPQIFMKTSYQTGTKMSGAKFTFRDNKRMRKVSFGQVEKS